MHQQTSELSLTGRLLLWSWRHAARVQRRREDLPHFVRYTLAQLPQGERVTERAETLFLCWILGARRRLHLACPDARLLSRDEATLIEAMIAAGLGLKEEVRLLLADMQHRGGLRRTSRACAALAGLLRELDLPLSQRSTCMACLELPIDWTGRAEQPTGSA